MKKLVLLSPVLCLSFLLLTSCQEDLDEAAAPSTTMENSLVPFKVEEVPFDGTIEDLPSKESPFARVSCSLSSDQGCSDVNRDGIVDDFIRFCTTYPYTPVFSGTVVNYYFFLTYYVDSDSDINLDRYEDDIQAQVDAISAIVGRPMFLVLGDVQSWPCRDRQDNSGLIKYTVYY